MMSDSFADTSSFSGGTAMNSANAELQDFLEKEKQKAQFNAQGFQSYSDLARQIILLEKQIDTKRSAVDEMSREMSPQLRNEYQRKIEECEDRILHLKSLIPNIKFTKSNIFLSSTSIPIVLSVPKDNKMKRGFAVGLYEFYPEMKNMSPTEVGTMTPFTTRDGRIICSLITKKKFFHIPRDNTIINALFDLKSFLIQHSIKQISMPQICCGCDGKVWAKVREWLQTCFFGTGIKIYVYVK